MLAVDTNVVVRYLVRDHPVQSPRAAALIESEEVWVPKTVLLETEWILRSLYSFAPEAVAFGLRNLAGLESVTLEDETAVVEALNLLERGMDFADALHLACSAGARFATFDRKLASAARRLSSAQVLLLS